MKGMSELSNYAYQENGKELTKYFTRVQIRCRYIHSDVETLERVEIMQDLRKGLLMF